MVAIGKQNKDATDGRRDERKATVALQKLRHVFKNKPKVTYITYTFQSEVFSFQIKNSTQITLNDIVLENLCSNT